MSRYTDDTSKIQPAKEDFVAQNGDSSPDSDIPVVYIEHLPDRTCVPLPADDMDYLGRQCPDQGCQGYFKVKPYTGVLEENIPCYCPYCGHKGESNDFATRAQIEYAHSIAENQRLKALIAGIMELEASLPDGVLSACSFDVEAMPFPLLPVRYYHEETLETEVTCDSCTLQYAIYGVFAYCPDCRKHNSLQILNKNLELVEKQIALAATTSDDVSALLIGSALQNAVAAFDGFGREMGRVYAAHDDNPTQVKNLSFQNLSGAQKNMQELFGFDIAACLEADSWTFVLCCFQKRHLLAHSMGIINERYIEATSDSQAVVGRKVIIRADEVTKLVVSLQTLGASLEANLKALHP